MAIPLLLSGIATVWSALIGEWYIVLWFSGLLVFTIVNLSLD